MVGGGRRYRDGDEGALGEKPIFIVVEVQRVDVGDAVGGIVRDQVRAVFLLVKLAPIRIDARSLLAGEQIGNVGWSIQLGLLIGVSGSV